MKHTLMLTMLMILLSPVNLPAEPAGSDFQTDREIYEYFVNREPGRYTKGLAPAGGSAKAVSYAFRNIRFKFDSDLILPESHAQLDHMARAITWLAENGVIRGLRLLGHSDIIGNPNYNRRLSGRRAEAVARYLKNRGVRAPVKAIGVGAAQPLPGLETIAFPHDLGREIERQAPNRRVELEVTYD